MTPKTPSAPVPPWLVIGIGILAVSTAAIFIRLAQEEVLSLVIAAYRLVLAALVLLPFVLLRRGAELRGKSRRAIGLGLLAGLFLAMHFATWISSLAFTSVATSVVLVSTVPIWVGLLSPVTIKEPVSRGVGLGILFSLLGSLVIIISETCTFGGLGLRCGTQDQSLANGGFLGEILAVAGALMGAGYLLVGRSLRTSTTLPVYTFLVYGFGGLLLTGVVLLLRLPISGFSPSAYLWLLLLGLVPQLIGHSSFNWALGYLPAAFVSITMLGEPIGSILLALVILQEAPTVLELIGAILILLGIYLAAQAGSSGEEEPAAAKA